MLCVAGHLILRNMTARHKSLKKIRHYKWVEVNVQRACSWHRLTLVIHDQEENKPKTSLLKRKCQKVLPEQKITSLILVFPKRTSDSLVAKVHQNLRAKVAGHTVGELPPQEERGMVQWYSHTRTAALPKGNGCYRSAKEERIIVFSWRSSRCSPTVGHREHWCF